MTATVSTGAANTGAGYCMLINVKELNIESKVRILDVLGRADLLPDHNRVESAQNDMDAEEDSDLVASQDFPNYFQSQTADTLLHCTVCEFMTRLKHKFEEHVALHPTCKVCTKKFLSEDDLEIHMNDSHHVEKVKCTLCTKEFLESDLSDHLKEHERFSSFRKGLEATKKPGKSNKAKEKPAASKKKALNCYLIFAEEHRNEVKDDNPGMPAVQVTKILSQMWQKLSETEKNEYKEKAKLQAQKKSEKCPKCEEYFNNQADVISHMVAVHMSQNENERNSTMIAESQATIKKCNMCGRMFLTEDRLETHMRDEHNEEEVVTCNGGCGGACNGVCATGDAPVATEIVTVEPQVDVAEEGLRESHEIVWAKISTIFWPAKVVRKLGELTEIQLFDNENTKKIIQNTKLKPFQALKKLPNNKSKYWKEAYQLALSELNKE